jgi:hypothetical protein
MYGMSQELMDRMERRIRDKVYREIQEEQEKMRNNVQEDTQSRDRRARRARTESSQNEFIPDKPQRMQSRNEGQELQQQSFFLPILNSNRKTMDREEPENHNYDYQKYLSRRQPQPKLSNSYQPPVSHTQ